MSHSIGVEPLARHTRLIPLVEEWFRSEWPAWYGIGGEGNVSKDVQNFAVSQTSLPIGFVAFSNGAPVGAAALKAESIPSHKHLSPWAAAGYVVPERRGQGIGAVLLHVMAAHARDLGYLHVYCGTSTAETLLLRSGWSAIDKTLHAGRPLTVFRSAAYPLAQA